MAVCLIGLGANLGDRVATLTRAAEKLAARSQISSYTQSGRHCTAAVGGPPGQGEYLNAAARFETALTPHEVLVMLQQVENELGRQPGARWGPRVIDLDLLLYDDVVLATPALELPHPRMAFRRFVLEPATEVAGDMIHPRIGWTVRRLLEHLNTALPYVAITGVPRTGKTRLAQRVGQQFRARLILNEIERDDLAGGGGDFERSLLVRRAKLLDRRTWPEGSVETISDFWFDQSLAYARLWAAGDIAATVEQWWRRLRADVVSPKLLVLMDPLADWSEPSISRDTADSAAPISAEQIQQLIATFREQATQPGQGPFFLLPANEPDQAADELAAAIAAMR